MKLLSLGLAASALAFGSVASADPWYGKISVGQTTDAEVSGASLSDDIAYGAALGTGVGPFRVEAGVSRLSGSFANVVDADALDYQASAFLDLPVGDHASIFAGAGVDYVDGEANIFGSSISADGTGYHYALGGAYRLREGVIGEVQWRHLDADLSSDFGDADLSANEITVGLRLAL